MFVYALAHTLGSFIDVEMPKPTSVELFSIVIVADGH